MRNAAARVICTVINAFRPFAAPLALVFVVTLPIGSARAAPTTAAPTHLDCATQPCAEVLPGAVSFVPDTLGRPFHVGKDAAGATIGWVALSTELVDINAYSGKPMVTLLGLGADATVRGVRVLHHSEPILLVGIPEGTLGRFVDTYNGMDVRTRVVFGHSDVPGVRSVDAISGATVTACANG